jgi:hypothetical protein
MSKIDPTKIYECLEGHGVPGSIIPTGAHLRGSELLAMKEDPRHYLEFPYSDSEKLAAMHERGYIIPPHPYRS